VDDQDGQRNYCDVARWPVAPEPSSRESDGQRPQEGEVGDHGRDARFGGDADPFVVWAFEPEAAQVVGPVGRQDPVDIVGEDEREGLGTAAEERSIGRDGQADAP
jgi:hypothetical protein